MQLVVKDSIEKQMLPGRIISSAVGKNAVVKSEKMTVGFAKYCPESGPMSPHNHAEETIYVIESKKGYVRYGKSEDELGEKIPLESGMILVFDELEWHVFEYDEGGEIEIIFIYGQVDNIRPEEILNNKIK